MSGINFLLDTNFVLGLLKREERIIELASHRKIVPKFCGVSAITRMELLGFPGIASEEEQLLKERLSQFRYVPITREIENVVISLRRIRQIKLPDAIIAGTAFYLRAELLTLDQRLLALSFRLREIFDQTSPITD
ncbi:type II toxin-antitoxin system VapC family toxin [Desulfonatronum lacustre]|uniref:type II toxin-antitoxin system VapC family toxin n=1 Tax=Desulfonatronum lacustre TaxID=66849 RepID=UPI0004BA2B67|nr:type II toxin-antitoxin system VapC family toxin [Desulfonatronum lacustre]